jgi:hypothetical protein
MLEEQYTKRKFLDKIDVSAIGFLLGIVVPVLAFLVYYQTTYSEMPFKLFLSLIKSPNTASTFIKISVFANLPLFLIFNMLQRFMICRGIFFASMIYILLMFYIKFVS